MENALNLDTVRLADNKKEIVILDQTLLPNQCKYLSIKKRGRYLGGESILFEYAALRLSV